MHKSRLPLAALLPAIVLACAGEALTAQERIPVEGEMFGTFLAGLYQPQVSTAKAPDLPLIAQ